MAIFRGALPADDFAIVANHWFRDPRLSGKAKGYMGYIATHSPQYRLTVDQLIAEMREGKDAVYAGLEELVDLDYLVRTQARDGGQFGEVDYHFGPAAYEATYDRAWPKAGRKTAGRTASGKPGSGDDQGKQDETAGRTASGKSGSGKPASGKSESKKITTTSSKKTNGLEDQEKKTPPTPRDAEPPAPPVAEAETGGDSSASPEEHTDDTPAPSALDRLTAELAEAGRWDADVVRSVLVDLADRGIDRAEIARVFREVAAGEHGPTRSPRRLLTWWPAPKTAAAAPAEPYKHKPAPPCLEGCDCWKHEKPVRLGDRTVDTLAALRATLPAGKPTSRYGNQRHDAAAIPSRRRLAENAGTGSHATDRADTRGNAGTAASGEISTESDPAAAAA
jgi:hypothetical protein